MADHPNHSHCGDFADHARAQGLRRVVVGVDGSEDGLRAVRYGATTVLNQGGVLHLVHAVDDAVLAGAWGVVYDPTVLYAAGEQASTAALEAARRVGLSEDQLHHEVALGNASAVLTRLSEGAHLVVVGRRSLSGLERMFIGSTSVSVALGAHCPVIVVSHATNPQPTGDKGVVGVGVDADSHSAQTLDWAFQQAAARVAHGAPTRVVVLHVAKSVPAVVDQVPGGPLSAAEQGVAEMLAPVRQRFPEVDHEVRVVVGNPVDELVALSQQADLLVLGVQRPRALGFMGGVMRGVLAHAASPMALVR